MNEQDIYAVIRSVKRKLKKVNLDQIAFALEPVGDGFVACCWWKDKFILATPEQSKHIYNPVGKTEAVHLEEGLIEMCLEFVKNTMVQADKADKLEFAEEPEKTWVHYTGNEDLSKEHGLSSCFKELDW